MMNNRRVRILQYNTKSASARMLKDALIKQGANDVKLLATARNSTYKQRPADILINWGQRSCGLQRDLRPTFNGNPDAMRLCVDKLAMFKHFEGMDINPWFWTRKEDIPLNAYPVAARTVINGARGEGLVWALNPEEAPEAPLYTLFVPTTREYRMVMGRRGGEAVILDELTYTQNDKDPELDRLWSRKFDVPLVVKDVALRAMGAAHGLDFTAMDIVYNAQFNVAYVLEMNSAPELIPSLANKIAAYILGGE